MDEEKTGIKRRSVSRLTDWHVQITPAQKTEIEKHCELYNKSQGRFVREAISYLLGFYNNLEKKQ